MITVLVEWFINWDPVQWVQRRHSVGDVAEIRRGGCNLISKCLLELILHVGRVHITECGLLKDVFVCEAFFDVNLTASRFSGSFEASEHAIFYRLELVLFLCGADVEYQAGFRRDDIGCPVVALDDPVHADRRVELLTQGGDVVVREYRSILGVDGFPW